MTYERYFKLISLTKMFGWFEFIFWEAGMAGGGGRRADNGIGSARGRWRERWYEIDPGGCLNRIG